MVIIFLVLGCSIEEGFPTFLYSQTLSLLNPVFKLLILHRQCWLVHLEITSLISLIQEAIFGAIRSETEILNFLLRNLFSF